MLLVVFRVETETSVSYSYTNNLINASQYFEKGLLPNVSTLMDSLTKHL
jgi:hypothetical protein